MVNNADKKVRDENSENSENSENKNFIKKVIDDKVGIPYSNINSNMTNYSNYSNYSNMINYSNYSNIISTLGEPKDKAESVYFLLFCEPDCSKERILEISKYSENAFYNLKSREGDKLISSKVGLKNKVVYNISQKEREQLTLRINQAVEQKQRIKQNKAETEKREAEESATQKDFLAKIKNIISNKDIVSYQDNNPVINLKELKEQESWLYEKLLIHSEETRQLFDVAFEEAEFNNPFTKFSNLDAVETLNIENYRTKHLGIAVCSEAKITTISEVRSLVTNAKFECPSCGTIISVIQIDKKFKEPSRCSCGRRGRFKEIAKDMVDTTILVAEDIEPKSQLPISKAITCSAKGDLLKPNEIEKLIPGNHLRIFGILKEIATSGIGGVMLTRFDWDLELISVEEFDPELNSIDFTEEEIGEYKKVSSRINKEGLDFFVESYAPDVEVPCFLNSLCI